MSTFHKKVLVVRFLVSVVPLVFIYAALFTDVPVLYQEHPPLAFPATEGKAGLVVLAVASLIVIWLAPPSGERPDDDCGD